MDTVTVCKCLNKLKFLETTAIVTCEIGDVTIEVTQDNRFLVDGIIDYKGTRQPHRIYKKAELDMLRGYLGKITNIMTLNHDTDEEAYVF